MMEYKLLNQENAYKYVIDYLMKNEGYMVDKVEKLNLGRYTVVYGHGDCPNIAIQYKREFFLKFGTMFNPDKKGGVGDSINVAELKEYIKRGVQDIYTVYHKGEEPKIYKIGLMQFLTNSIRWQNKEGKDVRSISIHELERVNNPISA